MFLSEITQNQGERELENAKVLFSNAGHICNPNPSLGGKGCQTQSEAAGAAKIKAGPKHLEKAPCGSGLWESLQSRPAAGIPEGRIHWSKSRASGTGWAVWCQELPLASQGMRRQGNRGNHNLPSSPAAEGRQGREERSS